MKDDIYYNTTHSFPQEEKHVERFCKYYCTISGLQTWCEQGVFPMDCANCDKAYWVECEAVTTAISTTLN